MGIYFQEHKITVKVDIIGDHGYKVAEIIKLSSGWGLVSLKDNQSLGEDNFKEIHKKLKELNKNK